jgi:NADPH:quinone reductase-like Zn-dependent oxidoreductase
MTPASSREKSSSRAAATNKTTSGEQDNERSYLLAFSRDAIASKIDKVLPLSRIEDAHHHLNSNSEIGKIVVVP